MVGMYPEPPQGHHQYNTMEKQPAVVVQVYQTGGLISTSRPHSPEWTTGLMSCDRPMGTCLYALCLPACALATMRNEYDSSNWCFNILSLNPTIARNILRAGYGIEGSVIGDICVPLFCMHCVTAQMLHEVRVRGPIKNPSQQSDQWRHSLCAFDMVACLLGFCLPNCGIAMAREKYDGSSVCLNCLCMPPALGRNIIREGYGIEGDCCSDLCASMWLLPCVVSQMYQEAKDRGNVKNKGGPHAHTMR